MGNTALRTASVIGLLLGLAGCGAGSADSFVSGDGLLDCDDGEVVGGDHLFVAGATEDEVVAKALKEWTDKGGSLVQSPQEEAWFVVLDGRDVASALPERNGDGTWVVVGVQVCGDPVTGPAAIDSQLDCANESTWVIQGSLDPDIPGAATADEAVQSALSPYQKRHGGEIALVEDAIGSLVVGQREQVVAIASELEAGGWSVGTLTGCEGVE